MISLRLQPALTIGAILSFAATSVFAQNTINVPADQPTIQSAINAAAPGDTVLVAPGTYVENINFGGKAMTVTSSAGASSTIIDGNASSTVVTFNQGESAGAVLNGFTIRNGRSVYYGGGIEISGSSPRITNNIITGNGGISGVAIHINGGSPLIQGNTITQNVQNMGSGGGGAIYISAASGVTSNVSVIGNVITDNHLDAGAAGGGISLNYFAYALIENNYIAGNSAYNGGGGIDAWSDVPVTIVGNIIVNNSSGGGGDGGGLYVQGSGQVLVLNNTLYGNKSTYSGTSEIATWVYPPNAIFKNNIVYATSGTSISCPNTNGVLTATNNIVYSVDPATNGNCPAFVQGNGNLFTDPSMVNPLSGDFRLQAGSPAIDAGATDNSLPSTDIAGAKRVLDGNNDGVAVVDVGAYEFVPLAAGALTLSSTSISFSGQLVGTTSSPQLLTLINSGTAVLNITSLVISGGFAQTNNCSSSIAPGAACSVSVTFAPASRGSISGSLVITTNAPGSPVSVTLSGTGLAPSASLSSTSLAFAMQRVGSASPAQVLTLSNTGNSALTISSVAIKGAIVFAQTNNCPTTLAAGAVCSINVIFQPAQSGTYDSNVVITDDSDAVSGSTQDVFLTGTGGASSASLSSSTLSFASTNVGASSTPGSVTLTNTGTMSLNISAILVSGDFSQSNNCGSPVAPGASCAIYVTFTPAAAGTRTGALTINDDSQNGGVQTVALLGTGLAVIVPPSTDVVFSKDQGTASSSITVSGLSTRAAGEYLLAFVATDGPGSSSMTVSSITTSGLTWKLLARANQQSGTAEIWGAWSASALINASVQARLSKSESASLTVVALAGVNSANPIGTTAVSGARSGAPTVILNTVGTNSLVFAVGNDWDNAIARTVGPNQALIHQFLSPVGDTYWVQGLNAPIANPATVTINDVAPSSDRYNLAAVEVLAQN